jgi:hypothetical protein
VLAPVLGLVPVVLFPSTMDMVMDVMVVVLVVAAWAPMNRSSTSASSASLPS